MVFPSTAVIFPLIGLAGCEGARTVHNPTLIGRYTHSTPTTLQPWTNSLTLVNEGRCTPDGPAAPNERTWTLIHDILVDSTVDMDLKRAVMPLATEWRIAIRIGRPRRS